MRSYLKSVAISAVAPITLPQHAQPTQEANHQAYAAKYAMAMAIQHALAQYYPRPLKNNKSLHLPQTTKPFRTTKSAEYSIRKAIICKAPDARTFTFAASAKEATQSGPALIALDPLPIHQHKICTP